MAEAKKATPATPAKKATPATPSKAGQTPAAVVNAAPTAANQAVGDPEKAELLAETTEKTGQTTAAAARAAAVNAAPVQVARDRSLDAAPVPASSGIASEFVTNAQGAPAGRDRSLDAKPVAYTTPTAPEEDQNGGKS